jgi:hypothetical protein
MSSNKLFKYFYKNDKSIINININYLVIVKYQIETERKI